MMDLQFGVALAALLIILARGVFYSRPGAVLEEIQGEGEHEEINQ
jgi:hypothetical protein